MSEQVSPLTILILHGLWQRAVVLSGLATRLRRRGWSVRTIDYWSLVGRPRSTLARISGHIEATGRDVHLVGHSLGGVLAVSVAEAYPTLPIRRIVTMGSPLCGSEMARRLSHSMWTRWATGASARMLCDGVRQWPPHVEVGAIAGTRPVGPGVALGLLGDEPSDGTVRLQETRAHGLADHLMLPVSHTGMVWSLQVARAADCFLRHGRFFSEGAR